jgi:hypothetical protein
MDDGLVSVFIDDRWQRITPEESVSLSAKSGEPMLFYRREWAGKEPVYGLILARHRYRQVPTTGGVIRFHQDK